MVRCYLVLLDNSSVGSCARCSLVALSHHLEVHPAFLASECEPLLVALLAAGELSIHNKLGSR